MSDYDLIAMVVGVTVITSVVFGGMIYLESQEYEDEIAELEQELSEAEDEIAELESDETPSAALVRSMTGELKFTILQEDVIILYEDDKLSTPYEGRYVSGDEIRIYEEGESSMDLVGECEVLSRDEEGMLYEPIEEVECSGDVVITDYRWGDDDEQ